MAGDEVGVKLVRFLYFVGAGVICTKAINLWRDYERNRRSPPPLLRWASHRRRRRNWWAADPPRRNLKSRLGFLSVSKKF
ncbi:hypothetical protein ACMD2_26146 [Ananas comosus]|uniref:Uncharacterized protein n=1 Tax=Ananas comosus TaxID=4615 RepID=A0A199UPM0_ANACO|nr:hypothetical protein ACMD2_26146 [Ananas comosus]